MAGRSRAGEVGGTARRPDRATWLSAETLDDPDRLRRKRVWIVRWTARAFLERGGSRSRLAVRRRGAANGMFRGDVIVTEAGGIVTELAGERLRYDSPRAGMRAIIAAAADRAAGELRSSRGGLRTDRGSRGQFYRTTRRQGA